MQQPCDRDGAPEADYPDASNVLSGLRLRKEKSEVDAMRRAVKIAQEALVSTQSAAITSGLGVNLDQSRSRPFPASCTGLLNGGVDARDTSSRPSRQP